MIQANFPVVKAALVGAGRMGRHHARTWAKNVPGARLAGVVDARLAAAEALAAEFGAEAFDSVEALLAAHPDLAVATVATPTIYHTAAALPLLRRGIGVLIEKPLAPSAAEARALAEVAARHGATLQVGHVERYNPAVRALVAQKLKPRHLEAVRTSPMTFRSLDVSVIMDMGIHDLDILLALAGAPVVKVEAHGQSVVSQSTDHCSAWLIFANGVRAHLTSSRLALTTTRTLKLFADDAFAHLDYGTKAGAVYRMKNHAGPLAGVQARLANNEDLSAEKYADMLQAEVLDIAPYAGCDQLTAQATAFLDAVLNKTTPVVTAQDGINAIVAAEMIAAAISANR